MILLIMLLLQPQTSRAENYFGANGSEVVSDFETSAFAGKLELAWKGDAFAGVPGYSAPRPRKEPEMSLQATIPGDRSLAVVNDKVVGAGEHVNGKKIRKIGPNYVLLEQGGSVQELSLENKAMPESPGAARSPASEPAQGEGTIRIEERPSK